VHDTLKLRPQMPNNLLIWPNLQPTELMILLHECMGGTWQGDLSVRKPRKLYIPMFGPTCRVILKFDGPKIVAIEPGEGFDPTQWKQNSSEIENSVLRGPTRVGREYSFCGRCVTGSWRGELSGVQILPPPDDLPRVPTASGDHPFILEFPLMKSDIDRLNNHRGLRKYRDLTLLLNILLVGGVKAKSSGRSTYCWAGTEWVEQGFSPAVNPFITDALSAPAATQLEELEPEEYDKLLGHDGMGLRVPSDLDHSICLYEGLSGPNREKFDRAAFWFSTSSLVQDISISSAFAALAFAIESLTASRDIHQFTCPICGGLTEHRVPGPTKLFKNFLATYAPGASTDDMYDFRSDDVYDLRSDVVHGEHLLELDREIPIRGWTPPGFKERQQYYALWGRTRRALRNWLKSRSRDLQQDREVCAYFHWINRGRPLWEGDIDWAFAEQEFPA
jgi:hypothetical protein